MSNTTNTLLPINIQLFAEGGDNDIELDIDDLFNDPEAAPTSTEQNPSNTPDLDMTKAMTKRINEVKAKTEREAQDKVAKDLGFENYAAMKKAQEEDLIKQRGYDPEDMADLLEPLIQKRLADDPRLKKLEQIEARERDLYVQSQLAAINQATGQQLKMADLPQDTLDLWSKGIELEQAYYATHGKTLLTKTASQNQNGSLAHLATGSSSGQVKTRRLTNEEKEMWRAIVPGITEEELSKKTTKI